MTTEVRTEGAKSDNELLKEAQNKSEVRDRGAELDMVVPIPVELPEESRDIPATKITEDKLEKAEEANQQSTSATKEATPVNAKKRQTRKRKNVEPTPPSGTPTPDYILDIVSKLNSMDEEMKRQYEVFNNLQIKLAKTSTATEFGESNTREAQRPRYVEPTWREETYVPVDNRSSKAPVPLHSTPYAPSRERVNRISYGNRGPVVNEHEAELFARRNDEALKMLVYDTRETQQAKEMSNPTKSHWFTSW